MKYVLFVVPLQLFALLGFVVSAVLISATASEVVSLLHMLGVVLSLSNTVLGLTLLAWGNSIGGEHNTFFSQNIQIYARTVNLKHICVRVSFSDCFSDITIARQGYPRMAISACFGGIIFSILIFVRACVCVGIKT